MKRFITVFLALIILMQMTIGVIGGERVVKENEDIELFVE